MKTGKNIGAFRGSAAGWRISPDFSR